MALIPPDKPGGFISYVLPLADMGLRPRTLMGLVGIISMPFLHQDLAHIASNTMPLIVLLFFVAGIRAPTSTVAVSIILIGGVLLWLFGRSANHIGASLLVFGLTTYLVANGYFQRKIHLIMVSIIVGVLYGGNILFGVWRERSPASSPQSYCNPATSFSQNQYDCE